MRSEEIAMRARQPDSSGYVVNDGVRVYYEVHGTGSPTILLMPSWAITQSRMWKMQVPYLARHFRVLTYDPRGNGRSDRPADRAAYDADRIVDDALAVMDATGTDEAVLVGLCTGALWAHDAAAARARPRARPGRDRADPHARPAGHRPPPGPRLRGELDTDEGWAKENRAYWKRDWEGYIRFYISQLASEPHSTKVYDDMVGWGLDTDAETMLHDEDSSCSLVPMTVEERAELCRSISCPVLAIAGTADRDIPPGRALRLAELTGGDALMIEGGGHLVHARHPVVVNHAIKAFVDRIVPPPPRVTPWLFARERPRTALWVSSPIGLGHVLRDLAIARAVRERVPDLRIEWLAQSPVTEVLAAAGEIVHPASAELASEVEHWEGEATGHDLHAFHAFRSLDETFCANYLLFDEVVRDTPYDLWVGDESWEVDHFLHENPERKIAPYVFTTDVVGFLPVDGDPREAELTADYNAEMIEHRARHPAAARPVAVPRRRRRAADHLDGARAAGRPRLGAGLVRDGAVRRAVRGPRLPRHRRAAHPARVPARRAAAGRRGRGYGGRPALLDLVAEGFAHLRKEVPDARMVMVTGPRISPDDITDVEGLTKHAFLPDAFAHLACADAAVVQGGLSTTMELVAAQRPFVYFPLARHWEQQEFVTHRLDHYRAGTRLDFATTSPRDLATAMQQAMNRRPRYRAVPRNGASVAGERIASLLTR